MSPIRSLSKPSENGPTQSLSTRNLTKPTMGSLLTLAALSIASVTSTGCSSKEAEAEEYALPLTKSASDESDFEEELVVEDSDDEEDLWADDEEDELVFEDEDSDWDLEDEMEDENEEETTGDYDIDQYLDDYEAYMLKILEAVDKIEDNDPEGMEDYMEALQDAQEMSEKLDELEGQMEPRHMKRLMEIQQKLTSASSKIGY